jgi:hypothetical protein
MRKGGMDRWKELREGGKEVREGGKEEQDHFISACRN